jgi:hypothetical protein
MGKGEAILGALLALLRVSLPLLTGYLIFLTAKSRRRARRELGRFVFIQLRSESIAFSFFLLQF